MLEAPAMFTAIPTITGLGCGDRPARKRGIPRILVAGLGNFLLTDDGVGVHAVRTLEKRRPACVTTVEVGTDVLDTLHLFEGADKVLAVDAIQAGGPPGTLYRFQAAEFKRRSVAGSAGVKTLISALEFVRRNPPEIVILGVEPESTDYGLSLSPPVRAAVPRLLREAQAIFASWSACIEPRR